MRIEKLEVPVDRIGDPLYAAHRKDGRFFNPWAPFPHRLRQLARVWLTPKPELRYRSVRSATHLPRIEDGALAITWIGHCTFVLQHGGETLVTDPHWGHRAKIARRKTPPGLALDAVPSDAVGLISHDHYDHLDRGTIVRLPREIRWVVPCGLGRWFRARGHRRSVELDWWQRIRVGGWTLTCLPAQHWSFRLSHGRNRTLWCSWLIETGSYRLYFAGDSGYFDGFREFGRRFGPIDAAFLPIATYEPRARLRYQHMGPDESWRALDDLRARTLLPMHWGTFQMGRDAARAAPATLRRVVEENDGEISRVRLLEVGETWTGLGS